jgi:hypothetical protein
MLTCLELLNPALHKEVQGETAVIPFHHTPSRNHYIKY